ncbi:endonuclease domain-containing protein [Pseudomonas syringae group sp. J309-1]|uniref:endonuclease domain-containing protein n=1 Tax=Pseudomonas syringae group sp. J309-1 TaxID=3079588 RepID=UPI00290B7E2E|nr:DUF559 domain-containing protein [Pseudomonas syringae group sp. J309-1]MDU8360029.1 DUF559 domain-containing protein [Pseudomonas syringae group sp. J309-1]
MGGKPESKFWIRAGLIAIILPLCFVFPYVLICVLVLAWVTFVDHISPNIKGVPPPRTWVDATAEESDWLEMYLRGCESPAEEQFLKAMIKEFELHPNKGKLVSSKMSLEMQVKFQNYRFDFVLNGKYIIEIDGATYHSSPEQIARDRIRDEFSVANGFSVLRIPASVVFNNPAESIRRVRDFALKSTTTVPKPTTRPAVRQKPVSQYLSDFSKSVSDFTQSISDASLNQTATSDFRKAISNEQMLLEAMVSRIQVEIRINRLPPEERKLHDDAYAQLTKDCEENALEKIFCWIPITLPTPVDNENVQRQIEVACADTLAERSKRFEILREKSANDPTFALLFHRYMKASDFPEMDLIHPSLSKASFRSFTSILARNVERNETQDL